MNQPTGDSISSFPWLAAPGAPCLFPDCNNCLRIIKNKCLEKVGKIAAFHYGRENGRSGKLSRESDGLETCSLEKDVAPVFFKLEIRLRSLNAGDVSGRSEVRRNDRQP